MRQHACTWKGCRMAAGGGEEAPTETHAGGEMLPWVWPEPLAAAGWPMGRRA